ncbi:MAG: aminotransferase class I/II-fold pyridoxal phosphate-dependent enzyme [Gaiella sp.]|nr:aminotransferase class I/II-fold pyridoxal phosphate-dependent enzyme [Gaiella sp.]
MTDGRVDAALVRGPLAGARRSGIRAMMDRAAALEGVLHLELGEPDFPTPPHVVEAVERALAGGQVKYTLSRGTLELRELLAEKVREQNRLEASPERLVVTAGGTAAVYAAFASLAAPGEGVLIPDPGWPGAELATTLLGLRPLRYRLLPEDGYRPDLDQLETLAGDARVLFLNTPSNPTGAVHERDTLERMLEIAERHGLVVVADEVYEDIVFDVDPVSIGSLGSEGRVVTVFSFSKGYAMTGWRVGYAVAPPDVAEAMVQVAETIVACPSSIGQVAAVAALQGGREPVLAMLAEYRHRRDTAVAALREHDLLIAEPRGTFYAMVDVSTLGADSFAIAGRLLEEQRIATAPGETFGPSGTGTVRLSLASPPDVVAEAIERIARVTRGETAVPA